MFNDKNEEAAARKVFEELQELMRKKAENHILFTWRKKLVYNLVKFT